jgi:hypothetical protein
MGVVTMTLKQIAAAAGLSVLLAIPATAHHSQVMYDGDTEIEMKGVVEEFDWANPHTWLYVTITDESGAPSQWVFESNSTGQLTRVGWSADSIKPGDEVTVIMHPLRDGTRGGTIVAVHMPDGTVLPSGGMRPDPIRGSEVIDR